MCTAANVLRELKIIKKRSSSVNRSNQIVSRRRRRRRQRPYRVRLPNYRVHRSSRSHETNGWIDQAWPSSTGLSSFSSLLSISDLSTGLIESSSSSLGSESEVFEWPALPQPLTRICLCD